MEKGTLMSKRSEWTSRIVLKHYENASAATRQTPNQIDFLEDQIQQKNKFENI